jgi:hypothetical protein
MSAAVGGAPRTELEFKVSDQARSAVDRVGSFAQRADDYKP